MECFLLPQQASELQQFQVLQVLQAKYPHLQLTFRSSGQHQPITAVTRSLLIMFSTQLLAQVPTHCSVALLVLQF